MNPLAKSRLEAALELAKRSLKDAQGLLPYDQIEQRETIKSALEFLIAPEVTEEMSYAYSQNDGSRQVFKAMITELTKDTE